MATQPQKDNLVKLFQESISSNKETIERNKERLVKIQSIIDYFDPSCKGFDNKIVSIVGQINTLKSEIVSLNLAAYSVGCGTTIGSTNIYPDTAIDNYYNLSSSTYEDDEPYKTSSQTLNSSNVGFGTFLTYVADNSQSASLGVSYADIGSCEVGRVMGCSSGTCASYASQISEKQSQIASLRSQINPLVFAVNILKNERVNYQTRRWSNKNITKEVTLENQRLREAIRILNDPTNDALV